MAGCSVSSTGPAARGAPGGAVGCRCSGGRVATHNSWNRAGGWISSDSDIYLGWGSGSPDSVVIVVWA